jgi:hypothetical protein
MFGEEIHVRRFGADGDVRRARELVSQFDGQVDAIGLGAMNVYFKVGHHTSIHQQIQQIATACVMTMTQRRPCWSWTVQPRRRG